MVDFNNPTYRFSLVDFEKCPKGISGIYKITNNINNKSYIGQGVNIRNRVLYHVRCSNSGSKLKIHAAIRKHKIDNFTVEILCIVNIFNRDNFIIVKELNVLECLYIEVFNSFGGGYNSTPGGDSGRLGYKHTEETILKMKNSSRGRTPLIAKMRMNEVFGYDVIDKVFYNAESVSEMSRKTKVNGRSIDYICKKQNGRFISGKNRFIFSFTKDDLNNMIIFYESGEWHKKRFENRSRIGKLNKGKTFKKRDRF